MFKMLNKNLFLANTLEDFSVFSDISIPLLFILAQSRVFVKSGSHGFNKIRNFNYEIKIIKARRAKKDNA